MLSAAKHLSRWSEMLSAAKHDNAVSDCRALAINLLNAIIGPQWIFRHPDLKVNIHYQADRMPIHIPPVKKEEPANHPTAEGGPVVAEGSPAAAEGSSVAAEGNPAAAEDSPAAAYIVNIAERQEAW